MQTQAPYKPLPARVAGCTSTRPVPGQPAMRRSNAINENRSVDTERTHGDEETSATDSTVEDSSIHGCEHCGSRVEPSTAVATELQSTTLYQCPSCERWTEGREGR